MPKKTLTCLALALLTLSAPLAAQTLKGSRASMERQHQEALKYGYTFLKTPKAVNEFVSQGHLVKIAPNNNLQLHAVSYPYARPEVETFLARLSGQYSSACGEPLTVTSLTRPINRQPSNAATDSVHPTGMAVDLRIPSASKCKQWLEKTLLGLEATGVLDVTRERNPAHYHVAVFTKSYGNYVASLDGDPADTGAGMQSGEYIVRTGDTLTLIAERMGTSVAELRAMNGIRGNLIRAGQKLQIPAKPEALPAAQTATTTLAAVSEGSASEGSNPLTSNAVLTADTSAQAVPAVASATQSKIKTSSAKAEKSSTAAVTHKVRRGDTLWEIANRYGTSTKTLKRRNGLGDDLLMPGQVLRIR